MRGAHQEASEHLTHSIELLQTLPDSQDRDQQELMLQMALGAALTAIRGYADPDVEQAYLRTHQLCHQCDQTPQLFSVLMLLNRFYALRGDLPVAREIGNQLLQLAQHGHDTSLLLPAYFARGAIYLFNGELVQAQDHLGRGIALSETQTHAFWMAHYGELPGILGLIFMARTLWLRGFPDQALQHAREARQIASNLSHPFSLAVTSYYLAECHYLRREHHAALEQSQVAMTLSTEQGFPHYAITAQLVLGWAQAMQGRMTAGLDYLRQALDAYHTTGSALHRTLYLSTLVEAYIANQEPEKSLQVLQEAFALAHNNTERFWKAELYRLKGARPLVVTHT